MTTQMIHKKNIEEKRAHTEERQSEIVKGNFSYLSMAAVAACLMFCGGIILYALVI